MSIVDRAQETSTTSGTGTYTTSGATAGMQALVSAGSGATIPYVAVGNTSGSWECGYGVVTSGSLTRARITSSSNSGAAVSWAGETITISCSLTAAHIGVIAADSPLSIDAVGTWPAPPMIGLCQPKNVQIVGGSTVSYYGKWAEQILLPVNVTITSLTFNDLEGMPIGSNFNPSTMASLTTLSLPALAYIGGSFNPNTMASLTTISLPALAYVGGNFTPSTMASLTTLSLPALAYVGNSFNPSTMASLTTLSLPALAYVGNSFNPSTMASLTTISLPALAYVALNFNPSTMAALTSLSLPALAYIGGSFTLSSGTAALSSVTIGSTLKSCNGNVTFSSCALTRASIESILGALAALDGTNGTTAYGTGKTVTITGTSVGIAALTSAGSSAIGFKATLVARGVTVTMNA